MVEKPFELGQLVVVTGHGVGRVTRLGEAELGVGLREGDMMLPLDDAPHVLRRAVDIEAARRLLERLCEECAETRTLPKLKSLRELARADLARQVEYLRWYFRKRDALHPTELDIARSVAETVVAELAAVLGLEDEKLRTMIRRGRPEPETAPLSRTLPSPAAIEGAEHLRSFWCAGCLRVGELPELDTNRLEVSARPGAWHAHHFRHDEIEGLLLLHGDVAPFSDAPFELAGTVGLEGGRIGVLDAAALDEAAFGLDEVEMLRDEGEAYGERGIEVSTWGDGEHFVFVDRPTAATRVFVSYSDEHGAALVSRALCAARSGG